LRRPVQGGGQRFRVSDVRCVPASGEAVGCQVGGELVDVLLVTRDQGDVEAFGAERTRDGGAQASARANDRDGGHSSPRKVARRRHDGCHAAGAALMAPFDGSARRRRGC
jgi:hypothetical protein